MNRLQSLKQTILSAGLDYSLVALADLLLVQWPRARLEEVQLALLVHQAVQEGHVCMPLDEVRQGAGKHGFSELLEADPEDLVDTAPFVGKAEDELPIVEDGGRLYLQRLRFQEQAIAEDLMERAANRLELTEGMKEAMDRLFPAREQVDYQKLAVIDALRHGVTIVSGGPGTGKTWTVARLIRLLLDQQPDLRISLAAPTGKAAARMSESLRQSLCDMPEELHERLPQKAVTLHRLLRMDFRSHRPRHDRENPLRCDLLILDEASMIDQNLMYAVCRALPREARLVLLGDKDQLASVEAGSVFADLCGGQKQSEASPQHQAWLEQNFRLQLPSHRDGFPLADQVVVLQESRRFGEHSGIGRLARAINQGQADDGLRLLRQEDAEDIVLEDPPTGELAQRYRELALRHYAPVIEADSAQQAMARFKRFRVLCAQWEGPRGVHFINRVMEQALKEGRGLRPDQRYHSGKPLMLTRNLQAHGLHNGDIGILWEDESGELRLWVENDEGGLQAFSLAQLPPHEAAYAMTVHKSQGSEFDEILLLMPEQENELCNRELLYTGITRARSRMTLWAGEALLRNALLRATRRRSGLRARLQRMTGP